MSKAVICDVCKKAVNESDVIETHGARIQVGEHDIHGEYICDKCMSKYGYHLVKFGFGEGSEYCRTEKTKNEKGDVRKYGK